TARAWDSKPAGAPLLHVEYTTGPPAPNAAPNVNAGPDLTVTLPAAAVLDGTVSDDGLPNPPATVTGSWTLESGPGPISFENANAIDTRASFATAGSYVLRLSGSDSVLTATDTTQITVLEAPPPPPNTAPAVSAGPDLTVTLPAAAALDGTVTDDGRPSPPGATTTSWAVDSGPGAVSFQAASAVDTQAGFTAAGTYVLRLTGSDGALSNSDTTQITVLAAPPPPPPGASTFEQRVLASADDAEEAAAGGMYLNSSDLELVFDGSNQKVGMRFTNVTVPKGATVTRAYLQLEAKETQSEATSLLVQGQAADNAATFTSASGNVSTRPRTAASVAWSPVPWTLIGETAANQRTPDLSAIVQEIVNRPGWTGGNALALIVTGTGHRTARAWDSKPAGAPLLHVEYNSNAPATPTNVQVTASTRSSISLSWDASTGSVAATSYGLYRAGTLVGSTTTTSATFDNLSCNTSYQLGVDAVSAAANRSGQAMVAASTAACPPDTAAPSTPTGLTQTGSSQTSVSLAWNASTDDVGVVGYDVFRDRNRDGTSTNTSYAAGGLTCGSSYSFTVQAKDAAGNVSAQSSELAAATAACGGPDPVITAAGDICSSATNCAATSDLVLQIGPTRALTLGDNAYNDGSFAQFTSEYDPNWGRFKANSSPSPGNHEYQTAGAADYFTYFGSRAPAAYYSFDLGDWHLISLASSAGVDPKAGGVEETWLKQDLAAHPSNCILAYWHEPRWSSGTVHGSNTSWDAVWRDLYAAHADVVLNGHEHNYERFGKQSPAGAADANGIREIVAGTGGASHGYPFGTPRANSEVRNDSTWGVIKLTLHSASYDWQFVPIAGSSFTDSGSDTCN
ncbi:MAG: fibronectin type III domain-containing protein, partial [Gaiellaceae bacterium]